MHSILCCWLSSPTLFAQLSSVIFFTKSSRWLDRICVYKKLYLSSSFLSGSSIRCSALGMNRLRWCRRHKTVTMKPITKWTMEAWRFWEQWQWNQLQWNSSCEQVSRCTNTQLYKLLNSNDNKAINNKTITMEQYDSWKVQRVREGQRKLEKVRGGGKVCTVMHADLT